MEELLISKERTEESSSPEASPSRVFDRQREESDDEDYWFEISKEPADAQTGLDGGASDSSGQPASTPSHSLESSSRKEGSPLLKDDAVDDALTYQEIMMFIKWINVFEDRRYASQMVLWLLLQFPIPNSSTLKHLTRASKMDFRPVPFKCESSSEGSFYSSYEDDENGQLHQNYEVLDYLFPFRMFQSIIDNLSNFQIIDLYNRLSGAASNDLRSTSLCYDTALTTIDREFVWPLPVLNEDVSKEVLFLVIKGKFDETVQFLKDSNAHYRRVCQELVAYKTAPAPPGTAKIEPFEYKHSRGKRERVKNSYFETIDERILQECHLLRYTLEQEYVKA